MALSRSVAEKRFVIVGREQCIKTIRILLKKRNPGLISIQEINQCITLF